jgi:nucleoside-diphosphate-sugar epimerase
MRIGVTGCTSPIGESVCKNVVASGFELFRIGRKEEFFWRLGEGLPKLELDCVIHLAHDRGLNQENFKAATESILRSLRNETFLINLSSTSSHSKAISNYGKGKYFAEKLINNHGGAVFKSGLIFRNDELSNRGMLRTIHSIVDKFPILPLPYRGRNNFYFSEIDTLAKLLVEGAIDRNSGTFRAFNPEAINFSELVELICLKSGKSKRVFHIPNALTEGTLQIARFSGSKGIVDSLLSLASEISQSEIEELLEPRLYFPSFKY